jgi:hypothetical protein
VRLRVCVLHNSKWPLIDQQLLKLLNDVWRCENLYKNATFVVFIFSINEKGLDEHGCSVSVKCL